MRVINAAPTFNTHLHRLESLCHQPKMNFASASKVFSVMGIILIPPNPPLCQRGTGGIIRLPITKKLLRHLQNSS